VRMCEAADCGNCTNDYYQYRAVFSGIDPLPTACISNPLGDGCSMRIITPPTDINETFTLTQAANPCQWEFIEYSNHGTLRICSNINCVTCDDRELGLHLIRLTKTSPTEWFLWRIYKPLIYTGFEVFSQGPHVVANGNCESTIINNHFAPPVQPRIPICGLYMEAGTGGIATITPV